ncbi:MAG TPA: PAS domain S-box protein [Burkholderiales bacterium]|nr:PAS domain S-box protein [Burkholderiales bacterium]
MKLPSVSLRTMLFAMIAAAVVPLGVLLPLAGWYVTAQLPAREALASVYHALWISLGLAALVVLGAVALAWVVARWLSRPVVGIVAAMQRAASGATDAVAPESGPREIALIGAQFNRMIAARARLRAERREALARAEAHEQRLAEIIDTITEGVLILGPDGRFELANRAEEVLLGVPRDRIVGVRYDEVSWKRVAADGSPFDLADHPFERLRRGEPPVRDQVFQIVTPQGRARVVSVNAAALRDAAGSFDGIVMTGVDITERQQAERRLRDIIDTMAEGLFIIDADGRYELINRAAEEMLGTPRERAIGIRFDRAPWGRRGADGSPYRFEDHAYEQLRRGRPMVRDHEIQFVPTNAPPRLVSVNAVPLRDATGNFDGIVATFADLTERKSAERRLRETIETMAEGLAIIGADGRYELFNRAAEELTGVPRERILGVRFDAVPWKRIAADGAPFRPEDHPYVRIARGEPPLRDYEYRVVLPSGAQRTVLTNAAALRDAAGNFDGIVATWSDVTERKSAERRLRDIIETMAEAVMIIGADGSYELVNREAEELLKRPRERIVGMRQGEMPWARLTVDGRPLRVDELPLERLRRGEPALHAYEFQLVLPDGPPRTILINAGPLRDAAGNFAGAVLSGFDITERKAAERRLAEYSARLGTLSRRMLTVQEEERRAVARELHDELGQVLTAVRLNLQTLRRRSRDPELGPVFEDGLALLETAIAEVRALSMRLRPTILDDLGLEAALRSHLERRSVRAELELDTDIRLPQRRLDSAVETACFRIVQEAMTNAVRHAGARRLAVTLRVVDGALVLTVRDDGQGFDLAAAARRAARGESAGLSGMEERAQLAGGRLEMNTAPGRGTEVRVVFPLAEDAR